MIVSVLTGACAKDYFRWWRSSKGKDLSMARFATSAEAKVVHNSGTAPGFSFPRIRGWDRHHRQQLKAKGTYKHAKLLHLTVFCTSAAFSANARRYIHVMLRVLRAVVRVCMHVASCTHYNYIHIIIIIVMVVL